MVAMSCRRSSSYFGPESISTLKDCLIVTLLLLMAQQDRHDQGNEDAIEDIPNLGDEESINILSAMCREVQEREQVVAQRKDSRQDLLSRICLKIRWMRTLVLMRHQTPGDGVGLH